MRRAWPSAGPACGEGQLAKDAPRCEGRSEEQLAEGPIDQRFDEAFQRLKKRASHVKVLASVGGWGGSDPFFHLANDPAKRARFAGSVDDNLAGGLKTMLAAGVPAVKLVAGVAMYGRGFTGVTPPSPVATRFNGSRREGVFAGADGSVIYREIASRCLDGRGQGRAGFRVVLDAQAGAYALWNPASRLYLGCDDPRAVWQKGRFAVEHGLAGVFAWELSQDNGDLLNAMNLGVGHLPRGR